MAVLTWIILLVLVNTDTGSSVMLRKRCIGMSGFCVSFPEEEIKAEAGLCVVIPCSFSTPYFFTPQNMVWFKCDASKSECAESDIIFHLNRRKVQNGFRERVSLLEPDLSLENCSIIVNDLTESDSGSYQLKLNGLNYYGNQEGFTFPVRVFVSAKALSQKPTVTVPPLTKGQQGSLTCTAPGLCSGSGPKITWTWTEGGKEEFRFTESLSVEKMTEVTWKMSSTLTFNSSAESHDANVTCAVRYSNNMTTHETVTLNVTLEKKGPARWQYAQRGTRSLRSPWFSAAMEADRALDDGRQTLLHKDYEAAAGKLCHHMRVDCRRLGYDTVFMYWKSKINSEAEPVGAVQCSDSGSVLPWSVTAVALIICVVSVICVLRLWKAGQKTRAKNENSTYMSLQKTHPTSEYDVIHQL